METLTLDCVLLYMNDCAVILPVDGEGLQHEVVSISCLIRVPEPSAIIDT